MVGASGRMPPGCLYEEVFRTCPSERRPPGQNKDPEEIMFLGWLGNVLVSLQRSWWKWPGTGMSGFPCSNCCPRDMDPGEGQKTKRIHKMET